jgi:hypothetical protein
MKKAETENKHRTVGISMSPSLEMRAKARAEALGLKFSTYVTQCLDAELKGFAQIMRDDSLDLDRALTRAREYMIQKTASIDFEFDVESVLSKLDVRFEKQANVGGQRMDFLVTLGSTGHKVAVECRHNIRQQYALSLGQGILWRAHPDISAVAIVIPYVEGFDPAVMKQFEAQNIHLTTPDALSDLIRRL